MTEHTEEDYIKMVDDDLGIDDGQETIDNKKPEPEVEEVKEEIEEESKPEVVEEEHVPVDPNLETIAQLREQNAVAAERLRVAEELAKQNVETDTRTDYQKAIDSVELSKEQQDKFNEYEELDEDQAKLYKEGIQRDTVLESIMDVQKVQKIKETEYIAEQERIATEQVEQEKVNAKAVADDYNSVISKNKNLTAWQKDENEWTEVNAMHMRMMKQKDYQALSTTEQMSKLESRYVKFIGLDPEQPKEEIKPNADKIIKEVEDKPVNPNSLSSFVGGDNTGSSGKMTIKEGVTGPELQAIMDKLAASDDPDAITKFLSGDGV